MVRKALGTSLAMLGLVVLPAPASASFHLMKIVEVFAGTATEPTAQYVMLQMYFAGQTFVAGHTVTAFDANGVMLGTFTFTSDLSNGADLATILIATPDADTLFGITADLSMTPVLPPAGGAVCYDVIDCVSWGAFSAPSTLPVAPGPPFNAPTGLLLDMAMHRTLSPGGSVTAFAFAPPRPQNNAGQSGMLSATPTMPLGNTPTPSPTVTPSQSPCGVGDCNGDGQVTVDELVTMVNIALGNAHASACPHGVPSGSEVDIALIIQAVNNALTGCAAS